LFLKLRKSGRQANRGKVLIVCADGIALKADLLCLQVGICKCLELSVKMSVPSDYGGNNMKYHAFIASRTKRVEIDNRFSIRLYYRMASNLLKQVFLFKNLSDFKT
jgi:hypothetical protein